MSRYNAINEYPTSDREIVLTIGNFDGVHRGHHALLKRARMLAAPQAARVVVITFEPHPISVLRPDATPPCLTTVTHKLALLERAGADDVIVLRSHPELFAVSARGFFEQYIAVLRPRAIVEGPTFHFGRNRDGTVDRLREMASEQGMRAEIVDEVICHELPERPVINSSTIRSALAEGRAEHANIKLGRAHRICGVVGHGESRGRTLGFPTANLDGVAELTPRHAVYAAVAQLDDGRLHLAAVNIGPQPTFEQLAPRVEAHLLEFEGALSGQKLGLHLLCGIRPQRKFDDVDELVGQLHADVARVREMKADLDRLESDPPPPL